MVKEGNDNNKLYKAKSEFKNFINLTLVGACFTIFVLIITIKPDLLKEDKLLAFQLVSSIPLMMTSIFARSKFWLQEKGFNLLGFASFLLGYAFLINVVGVFLIDFVSLFIGIMFFSVNIVCALIYSAINVYYDKKILKERVVKDLVFILIIVILGILPNL